MPERDPRLHELEARLKPLLSRLRGLALALVGAPGIGKTTLAATALGGLGCRYLSRPASVGLARLVADLPRPSRLPPWARLALERAAAGEEVDRAALIGAITASLRHSAPFVLHVDDAHEAKPELAAVLAGVAQACLRTPGAALLVATRHAPGAPFEELWLEPLGPAASSALLERGVGGSLPPAATAWIYERAAGNPLFTLEYQRQLARAGYLWSDGQRWSWREPRERMRPARVEAVIEHLIATAERDSQAVALAMEARALLPPGAPDASLWAEVADLKAGELEGAVRRLERLGLLRHGDFAHGLVRELALAALPAERRRAMAARAVARLRADPVAAARYVGDADLPSAEALALLRSAAEAAPYKADKARLMAQAVPYAEGEARPRLAYDAALLLVDLDLPAASRLFEEAAAAPGADLDMVRGHAHMLARLGRIGEVRELAARLEAQGLQRLSVADILVTSLNAAADHPAALAVWRETPGLHESPSFELLRAASASALAVGDMALAEELLSRGASSDAGADVRCEFLSLRALVAYHRGDYEASEALIAEAIAILRGLGRPRLLSTALLNRAAFLRQLCRFEEMNASLEECLRLRSQTLDGRSYAFAQAALAELRIDQARFAEAEDLLEGALETQDLYGPSRFLANTLSMACVLHLARGEPLVARHHAERALQVARESCGPRVVREILFDAAVADARLGDGAEALELAEEMIALGERVGSAPLDECRARWALGLALAARGDAGGAVRELRAALRAARSGNAELEANKVAIDLSRVEGDEEAALAALDWFEKRGLGIGRVLVRRAFPDSAAVGERVERVAKGAGPLGDVAGAAAAAVGSDVGQGGPGAPRLRLEVLGPMRLGAPGAEAAVAGGQRRLLLAHLLQARLEGWAEVTDLDLIEALYPELPEPEALRALKQLVHQVRRKFGTHALMRTQGGYALGDAVRSDVEEFLEGAAAADAVSAGAGTGGASPGAGASDAGPSALTPSRAAELLAPWRGPFLRDVPEVRVDAVVGRLTGHAARLAAAVLDVQPAEAARLARFLQDAAPYEGRLAALEVVAYGRMGDAAGAEAARERARRRLAEVGEELPADAEGLLAEALGESGRGATR